MKTSSVKKKSKGLAAVLALIEIEMAALATNIALERRQLIAARRRVRHHEQARAA